MASIKKWIQEVKLFIRQHEYLSGSVYYLVNAPTDDLLSQLIRERHVEPHVYGHGIIMNFNIFKTQQSQCPFWCQTLPEV